MVTNLPGKARPALALPKSHALQSPPLLGGLAGVPGPRASWEHLEEPTGFCSPRGEPRRANSRPSPHEERPVPTGGAVLGRIAGDESTTSDPFTWNIERQMADLQALIGPGALEDLGALEELVAIDSPTGYTDEACDYVANALRAMGYEPVRTRKGAVRCPLGPAPKTSVAAHVDTLGAVVSSIRDDGTLALSAVGGLSLNMAEGEYVRVRTLKDRVITGTLLLNNPSAHANKDLGSTRRSPSNMHIRLDEEVSSRTDTRALGVRPGDFICFEPRYEELASGYVKSRFLDNKAGCFVLLEVARRLATAGEQISAELYFSNYEEVGHGGTCGYSSSVEELLVIDMGVLGDDCAGVETSCSICAKDSSGPYDYSMRRRLVELAERHSIDHELDVYPYYGSDGSAALRAGHDFRVGLIGPGVAASHGVERTHVRGIAATIALTMAFLVD